MRRPKNDYVPAEYGGYILNDGIPTYTAEDAGKALKVNQDGVGIGWHEDIYDNTKNLLRNGKPTFSMSSDSAMSEALDLGQWYSWTLVRGDRSALFEWGDGLPYFHFTYDGNKTQAESFMQIEKSYKVNNVLEYTADEFKYIIPNSKINISLEFKSNIPITIWIHLTCRNQSGQRTLRLFNITSVNESAVADWTKLSASDVIPDNFHEIFFGNDTRDAQLIIQARFNDDASAASGDVYIRNIKMEYGDAATPFTYSDIDQRMIDYYIDSKLSNLVVYVNNPVFNSGGDLITGGTLNRTWNQINNALRNGIPVQIVAIRPVVSDEGSGLIVIHVQSVYGPVPDTGYVIDAFSGSAYYSFVSGSADGYPEYSDD